MSYKDLQNRLGYRFKDEALIELALTHKSFSSISNNERLEFFRSLDKFAVPLDSFTTFSKDSSSALIVKVSALTR